MSRRRSRAEPIAVETARAHPHDGLDRLAILTTRANLMWLAQRQRDVAAREASHGRALTGMPVHRSTEPRLPGVLAGPDLSGDIARALDELVRELMDVDPTWTPDERETVRWYQAAQVVEKVCPDEHDALAWWDKAADLRARAERTLGPAAAGRFMGWCAVPQCGGEIRMGDDEQAAVCPECKGVVTREQQVAYIVEELDGRLMTRSELATALVTVGADVPYSTLCRWIATGAVPEAEEGLYRFHDAFTRASNRTTRVRLGGDAA
jgi:hypothetical protein